MHRPTPASPGSSFFAYLKGSEVGEGEHLLAWAPVGDRESGVLVPAGRGGHQRRQVLVLRRGKAGHFVRTRSRPEQADGDGYFVKEGIRCRRQDRDRVGRSAAGA